jgi:uncharacterized membrane protein
MAEEVKKEEEKVKKEETVEKEVLKAEEAPESKETSGSEVNTMALLGYLGPLCLVPLLTGEKDEFVKFHVKQGMVLLICEAALWLVWNFLVGSMVWSWSTWGFYSMLSTVQSAIYLGLGILSVVGITNVINGKQKELPVVGKFSEKITFVK